jgi:hypothetical protein
MVTGGSPFAGLAKVILVIAVIGLVLGVTLSGTDLFNFITNSSKANSQAEKDAVDLKYYDMLKETETQAAIAKINTDSAAYAERVKNEVAFANILRLIVVGIAAGAVIGLVIVLLIALLRKLTLSMQPIQKEKDIWQNPQLRSLERHKAQKMERMTRLVNSSVQSEIRSPND